MGDSGALHAFSRSVVLELFEHTEQLFAKIEDAKSSQREHALFSSRP